MSKVLEVTSESKLGRLTKVVQESASRSETIKSLAVNVIGFFVAASNIYGYNPLSVGYFTAMCANGYGNIFSVIIMLSGMSVNYSTNQLIKYGAIMFAIYAITKLVSISQIKLSEKLSVVICFISVAALEYGDIFMENKILNFQISEKFLGNGVIPLAVALLTSALVIVFSKGMYAIKTGRCIYSSEEMFSISIVLGIIVHNLGTSYNVSLEIMGTFIYFALIFAGYKYGSGMGAIIGASCGIALCLKLDNPELLGVVCLIGIIAGIFRELGKLMCVLSVTCTCLTAGYVLIPYFISTESIKALIAAGVVFLILPKSIAYKFEDNIDNTMEQKVDKMCEEKLLNIAKSFEKLSSSIEDVSGREKEVVGDTDEIFRMNKVWKNKLAESREVMSKQLGQISQIIEEYSKEVYDLVNITNQEEEYIRHKLKTKKVTMNKIAGIENKRHKKEFLVTAKCEKGMTIGTREVAQIISEAMGKKYMPSRNCRKVLSHEFTTTTYVEEANFYVLHAAAKKARCDSGISGDNYSFQELENGQMVMSLSDGMGFGASACMESETVIELLEQLLDSGFSEETALKMINSVMIMNSEEEHPATLDFGIIDLHSGLCDLVKIGAAATFVKRGKWVEMVKSTTMPLGIFGDVDYDSTSKKLYNGDMIIMVSDGVIDALECENKDECLSKIIMGINCTNPKDIANAILDKAITDKSRLTDDMTVLVTGIWDNRKTA